MNRSPQIKKRIRWLLRCDVEVTEDPRKFKRDIRGAEVWSEKYEIKAIRDGVSTNAKLILSQGNHLDSNEKHCVDILALAIGRELNRLLNQTV